MPNNIRDSPNRNRIEELPLQSGESIIHIRKPSSMDTSREDDISKPTNPKNEQPISTTDLEPLQYDDNIILQACPSANVIFCDSVSALAEILSFEGDDDTREETPTKHYDQLSQRSPTYLRNSDSSAISKSCFSPSSDQCQQRGRFLVWPAALQPPTLSITEEA